MLLTVRVRPNPVADVLEQLSHAHDAVAFPSCEPVGRAAHALEQVPREDPVAAAPPTVLLRRLSRLAGREQCDSRLRVREPVQVPVGHLGAGDGAPTGSAEVTAVAGVRDDDDPLGQERAPQSCVDLVHGDGGAAMSAYSVSWVSRYSGPAGRRGSGPPW